MTDDLLPGEPPDGWITAPPLHDSVIASLLLCKYTGTNPLNDGTCPARALRTHRDEDCLVLFHSSEALAAGAIHVDMPAVETRVGAAGSDATYTPLKRIE